MSGLVRTGIVSLLIIMQFLVGCGGRGSASVRLVDPEETINIVATGNAPILDYDVFARSRPHGAVKGLLFGAVEGMGVGASIFFDEQGHSGRGSDFSEILLLPVLMFTGAVAGAGVGLFSGTMSAVPSSEIGRIETLVKNAVDGLQLNQRLAEAVWIETINQTRYSVIFSPEKRTAKTLEVSISRFGFTGGFGRHPKVALICETEYRFINQDSGKILKRGQKSYLSPRHPVSYWTNNQAKPVTQEIDRAIGLLSESIVDEAFLRASLPWETGSWSAGEYCGLKAIEPPVKYEQKGASRKLLFTKLSTRQPEFVWEEFPRDIDYERGDPARLATISDVVYDLRVYYTHRGREGRIAYRRDGLTTPRHKVEEPLTGTGKYHWTVRARYLERGAVRTTLWSFYRILPLEGLKDLCQEEKIPDQCYYRFVVP